MFLAAFVKETKETSENLVWSTTNYAFYTRHKNILFRIFEILNYIFYVVGTSTLMS
jgi:hypothetical protein